MPYFPAGGFRRDSDTYYQDYLSANRSTVERTTSAIAWSVNAPFMLVEETLRSFGNVLYNADIGAQLAARATARMGQLEALRTKARQLGSDQHIEHAKLTIAAADLALAMIDDVNKAASTYLIDVAGPVSAAIRPMAIVIGTLRRQLQVAMRQGLARAMVRARRPGSIGVQAKAHPPRPPAPQTGAASNAPRVARTTGPLPRQPVDLWNGPKGMTHVRRHAQHARNTAVRMGLARPTTIEEVQQFLWRVMETGEQRLGTWGDLGQVQMSRLGDAVVIRRMNGQYVSNLDYLLGGTIVQRWNNALPLNR